MADVFVSYRRSERPRILQINEALASEGLSVWFDARLEIGQGDGFDAEIEREVTSAATVLVCWTPEALKSIYVRAEAKKGLDRNVLVPVFLAPCTLPVPFNGVDTADLSRWGGDRSDPTWRKVVEQLKRHKDQANEYYATQRTRSMAAYSSVRDKVFPGVVSALLEKTYSTLRRHYHDDIVKLLDWLEADCLRELKELSEPEINHRARIVLILLGRGDYNKDREIREKLTRLIDLLQEIEKQWMESKRK